MDIVVADGVLKRIARLVEGMALVKKLPETVVDAVHAHVDVHKKVPRFAGHQVHDQFVMLIRHRIDLLEQMCLVLRAELPHIEHILAIDHLADLAL